MNITIQTHSDILKKIKLTFLLFLLMDSVSFSQNITISKVFCDTTITYWQSDTLSITPNYYGCPDTTNIFFFAIKTASQGDIFINLNSALSPRKVSIWGPFDCVENLNYDSLNIQKFILCDTLKPYNGGDTTQIYNAQSNKYYVYRYQDSHQPIAFYITFYNTTTAIISNNYLNDCTPTRTLEKAETSALLIYPNPVENYFRISNVKEQTVFNLYSVMGISVLKAISDKDFIVNSTELSAGIYSLVSENKNGIALTKIIISK